MKRDPKSTESQISNIGSRCWFAVFACALLALGYVACSDSEMENELATPKAVSHPAYPTLALSGTDFTINGSPTFLLGVSYFDGYNYHLSDLDRLRDEGFNLIRIWIGWSRSNPDFNGFFDEHGNWRSGAEARLLDLVDAASERGIVVDVTILSSTLVEPGGDFDDLDVAESVVRSTARALRHSTSIFYDVMNEHNNHDAASHADMTRLVAAARDEDPDGIIMYSSYHIWNNNTDSVIQSNINAEIDSGIDLLTPHLNRTSEWATETQFRVEAIRAHLASIGQNIPVFLGEEHRRHWNSVQPNQADFLTAARGALNGGAAGWILHTEAGFNMSSSTLFDNLDSVELATVGALADEVYSDDDEPPSTDCEAQYGDVAGVQFCSSTDSSCTFRALLNGTMSCADVCSNNGGSCIAQYGNGAACEQRHSESCDDVGSIDDICVCSLDDENPDPDPDPDPECDEQYGDVAGVQFCESTDSSCTFRALLNGTMSCDDVCIASGGSCIAQWGNGAACEKRRVESCGDVGSIDDICECTLETTIVDDCHDGMTIGDFSYCSPACQCGSGEGDCNSNDDCRSGFRCVRNVGAEYGWDPDVDVCE